MGYNETSTPTQAQVEEFMNQSVPLESVRSATPSPKPQRLSKTYRLSNSKVLSDEDTGDDLIEEYSHVLVQKKYGAIQVELVVPVERNGKTDLYGRIKLRENVPELSELEGFTKFNQYLNVIEGFATLDSHGGMASGVQAIKSWSGFVIEGVSVRLLWVTLNVSIQSEDDQWQIYSWSVVETRYTPDSRDKSRQSG